MRCSTRACAAPNDGVLTRGVSSAGLRPMASSLVLNRGSFFAAYSGIVSTVH
jgi:hypothetical protein